MVFLMAGNIGVSVLDLSSGLSDPETILKLVADFMKKRIVGGRLRHDQVNSKCRLRGAHAPNV